MQQNLFDNFDEAKRLLTNVLSDFEKKVFDRYLDNDPYRQIAKDLKCKPHIVNGAIMRIRRKAIKLKEE